MNEKQLTHTQIIGFAVLLGFLGAVVGAAVTFGLLKQSAQAPGGMLAGESLRGHIERQDELVVGVVEKAAPAVVSIVATKDVPIIERYYSSPFDNDPFFGGFFDGQFQVPQYRQRGTEKQEISAGTGFIVSDDGMIVTNKHVVAEGDAEYTVFLNDGKKFSAQVLARDPVQDIAILRIKGRGFPFLLIGDAAGAKIGQTVIAIGNALGEFRNTVSVGVVSGLQRSLAAEKGETLQELIQTDAAINPGNSGGPLLNIKGEVIGVNTAIAVGAENIGFAIPANKIGRDLESVEKHGRIIYPFLGVRYISVTEAVAEEEKLGRNYGAYVSGSSGELAIVPGSPAERSGLKDKDIILALNGKKIDQTHSLGTLLLEYAVGEEVDLTVYRDGKEIEIKVQLVERKE